MNYVYLDFIIHSDFASSLTKYPDKLSHIVSSWISLSNFVLGPANTRSGLYFLGGNRLGWLSLLPF